MEKLFYKSVTPFVLVVKKRKIHLS